MMSEILSVSVTNRSLMLPPMTTPYLARDITMFFSGVMSAITGSLVTTWATFGSFSVACMIVFCSSVVRLLVSECALSMAAALSANCTNGDDFSAANTPMAMGTSTAEPPTISLKPGPIWLMALVAAWASVGF